MYKKDEVLNLFPTPLMICSYPFDYSKELEWIKKQECTRKNTDHSGLGNHQSTDTFILNNLELKRVKTFILTKLNTYINQIYGSKQKLVVTQSWLNKSGKGDSHHQHQHPNSIISGVWYPVIHEKLPPIEFSNRRQSDFRLSTEKWNTFNSATFMLPLNRGELILFPSSLPHSVSPNQSEEERISLSFNTWAKGELGDVESLPYLPPQN